jgi:hypothetical protein
MAEAKRRFEFTRISVIAILNQSSNSHAFVVESGRERFNAWDLTVPRAAGSRADEQKYSIFQVSLDIE